MVDSMYLRNLWMWASSKHAKNHYLISGILNAAVHLHVCLCGCPALQNSNIEMRKLMSGSHQGQNFSQISKYVSTHYFSRSFHCRQRFTFLLKWFQIWAWDPVYGYSRFMQKRH